jgi:hypothetical protein
MARAAMLDIDFYAAVEADATRNREVFVVVLVANIFAGVGSALATEASLALGALAGAVIGVVGWILWSGIALFVGTRFLGGTADLGEMARVVGFSFTPLLIGIIPWLGFVGAAWALVATVIAIREGLDVSTPKAIVAMVPGWAAWLILSVVVYATVGLQNGAGWPF